MDSKINVEDYPFDGEFNQGMRDNCLAWATEMLAEEIEKSEPDSSGNAGMIDERCGL